MQVDSIRGAKPADHPFTRALRSRGMTITAWAASHGVTRAKAKGWFLGGGSGRRIPRDMAATIEKELGVPATSRVWRNGFLD